MTINEWTQEIHNNAKAHGWWDKPERNFAEIIALCHSELSEALEEDRAGKPEFYLGVNDKPEGRATELIDCIIRILDWCGRAGIDVETILEYKHKYNCGRPYKHGKNY